MGLPPCALSGIGGFKRETEYIKLEGKSGGEVEEELDEKKCWVVLTKILYTSTNFSNNRKETVSERFVVCKPRTQVIKETGNLAKNNLTTKCKYLTYRCLRGNTIDLLMF